MTASVVAESLEKIAQSGDHCFSSSSKPGLFAYLFSQQSTISIKQSPESGLFLSLLTMFYFLMYL